MSAYMLTAPSLQCYLQRCHAISWYPGVYIERDREKGVMTIDQQKYTEMTFDRFRWTRLMMRRHRMRMESNYRKYSRRRSQIIRLSRHIAAGRSAYLESRHHQVRRCICGDFMCAIHVQSGTVHAVVLKRILRYLKGTKEMKLTYTRSESGGSLITAYADADMPVTQTQGAVPQECIL